MKPTVSTSTHVIPKGRKWYLFTPDGRRVGVYATQREAVREAKGIVENAKIGQVVVHSSGGGFRVSYMIGLPKLARFKSPNPERRIQFRKALSSDIRRRLLSE